MGKEDIVLSLVIQVMAKQATAYTAKLANGDNQQHNKPIK